MVAYKREACTPDPARRNFVVSNTPNPRVQIALFCVESEQLRHNILVEAVSAMVGQHVK